jgi:hypothetical protein
VKPKEEKRETLLTGARGNRKLERAEIWEQDFIMDHRQILSLWIKAEPAHEKRGHESPCLALTV